MRQERIHDLRRWISETRSEWAGEAFPAEVEEVYDFNLHELRELEAEDLSDRVHSGALRTESGSDVGRSGARDAPVPGFVRADRDAALRTIDRNAKLSEPGAVAMDRLVRQNDPIGQGSRYLTAVGDPAYLTAFGKLLADPQYGHLRHTPAEVAAMQRVGVVEQERTAMATSPGAQGGFAIPYTLDPSILLSSTGALNPVRLLADVTQVSTHDWKGVSSDGVTAVYVAEGVEATDASPVLAQPAISTFQGRAFVPYSIELGQDYDTLTSELGKLIADARDVLDATMFLTGNPASNQPGGILNIGGTGGLTTTQRVQTATTATYVLADPWTFKAALPARWLNSVTFAANPATWDTTYRFVGGNSAEPLQMPTRDGPFMGRPKVEWSTMGTGTTTATKLIIGGDFSNYKIVDRIGMQVELIPHLFGATSRFPMGQRGLYAYWRTGAGVTVPNAFRYLEVK
jgi:HK97 family phage major capsid protein